MKEQKWIQEGLITESFPNGMFRVWLDNQDLILGYVSGKIRRSSIRILTGDKVKIEVSRYDSTKGRIIYRLPIPIANPNKDFVRFGRLGGFYSIRFEIQNFRFYTFFKT